MPVDTIEVQESAKREVMPLVISFRDAIDEFTTVENPSLTRCTGEGGRITSYED